MTRRRMHGFLLRQERVGYLFGREVVSVDDAGCPMSPVVSLDTDTVCSLPAPFEEDCGLIRSFVAELNRPWDFRSPDVSSG